MRRVLNSRKLPKGHRRDEGFTLVEVVVAIAILALVAGVIFRANSDSVRNIERADALANGSAIAQSLIAEIGAEIPLREGEVRGQSSNGLAWRVRMERYGDPTNRAQWPLAAYTVTAEVTLPDAADGQPVTLRTLRLGPKETWP
jgi:prepilin-type N-terminal cleavage/methylation domain-containing protein